MMLAPNSDPHPDCEAALNPDRETLGLFADLVFKHARPDAFVSLRLFPDIGSKTDKPIDIEPVRVGDKDFLDIAVIRATQAATWHEPAVFCPAVATFLNHRNAKADNICEGVCLSVECDRSPLEARSTLEALLGTATAVVESGGEWTNTVTGKLEPRVHLHWRLNKPTSTKTEHELLYEARALAANLVGGDTTNQSIVHPIRWPGSWHRKGTPRLATIVESSDESEIDLAEAIEILRDASGAASFAGFGFKTDSKFEACDQAAVAAALAIIPNNDLPWHDWNRIGMATWAATAGSEEGRAAFAEWSSRSEKNDPAATLARWQHYFRSPPTKIGFGSLVYLARQHSPGWTHSPRIFSDSEIARLAGLSQIGFEKEREAVAARLGIRLKTLDDAVKAKRKANDAAEAKRRADAEAAPSEAIDRMNMDHAILPIGGKARVVTFGELADFPGLQTITMTQTLDDFRALQNKYRHTWQDEEGKIQSRPLGSYWIGHPQRRQYDGGMAFMPWQDGDVGGKLNLWRGFGVKPIKGDCAKFLDFMLTIICSGNQEYFEYLRKREALIVQQRIRSEVALVLRTKEEGCGKGFYESTMGRLLGSHAMQISNPAHIIGKFNPHLETLLRLTADEALFVGNHDHRNALFGLITEPSLTIEPKGCGIYTAANFLNVSITSNDDHVIPASNTARRFFVPSVSSDRKQDHDYFAGLASELKSGGYEALLFHLLHEVDLGGFNVRAVPQTAELRRQRDLGLSPLDAWWVELLQTGTLWGASGAEPNKAVSNAYQREIEIPRPSIYGNAQTRMVNQLGIYDQARRIEPRLKNTSDKALGAHLVKMGCVGGWVMRRRGWRFPELAACRDRWVTDYPGWVWQASQSVPSVTWQPEEADDVEEI